MEGSKLSPMLIVVSSESPRKWTRWGMCAGSRKPLRSSSSSSLRAIVPSGLKKKKSRSSLSSGMGVPTARDAESTGSKEKLRELDVVQMMVVVWGGGLAGDRDTAVLFLPTLLQCSVFDHMLSRFY